MGLARLDAHGVAPIVLGGMYSVVQIVQNDSDERRAAMVLTLDVTDAVALWGSIEKNQIRRNQNSRLQSLYEELSSAIVQLYQRIIVLLGTMLVYFDKSRWAQLPSAAIPAHLDWSRMQGEVKAIDNKCDKIKQRITVEKDKEDRDSVILKWISSHDIRGSYRTVLERTKLDDRYKNRCQWLIDCKEFQSWCTPGNTGVLWLDGTIGTGKTTLMARAIREMKASFVVDVDTMPLAILFFQKTTDSSKELLSVQTCLQSLARQLSWNNATAEVESRTVEKFADYAQRG